MSIDVYYFSFSSSGADKQQHYFKKDITILRKYIFEKEDIFLNKRQEILTKAHIDSLFSAQNFAKSEVFVGLKFADLYYGSMLNEYFEDPKDENFYLENLVRCLSFETENDLPIKKERKGLYSNITIELIQGVVKQMMQQIFFQEEDGIAEFKKAYNEKLRNIYLAIAIQKSYQTDEEIAEALRKYLKTCLPPEDARIFFTQKVIFFKRSRNRKKTRNKRILNRCEKGVNKLFKIR